MSDIELTSALLAEVFPDSDVSHREYLRWLYEQSPFGGVIEANLDDEQGRAGHYALVPIALSRDGTDFSGALSLNTAVHSRARGGGTFVRLASETIDQARALGVETVVGVANANSTPGFVRRLDFILLRPLPASVLLPRLGGSAGISSAWVDDGSFEGEGLAADSERLMRAPAKGEARSWTPQTLRWRLARPGARYALHRSEEVLAVSCADSRHGVRVAILLKVFAGTRLSAKTQRALVRAACRFHRAPIALHVGISDVFDLRGVALPERLRESPLNLITRGLQAERPTPSIVRFEFLDFDAY
jgi:hypothetical protein